jgi:hypothetical protein
MKHFTRFLSYIVIGGIFSIFGYLYLGFNTEKGYTEYRNLYEYRRLHPEILPSADSIKMVDVGHHNTYADTMWIQFIQFVWDNAGNGEYLNFSHGILKTITELNPYFARPYEIDLLFTPTLFPGTTQEELEKEKKFFYRSIEHGKLGMQTFCDAKKIQAIDAIPIGPELWKRDDLKNPCGSAGMIPYYIALIYGNTLKEWILAERFYKIASMHSTDVPESSKFLGMLARSSDGDYRDSATTFFLTGQGGYDVDPYVCQKVSQSVAQDLLRKRKLTPEWMESLWKVEYSLQETRDTKNPESLSAINCVDSFRRGLKQLYIAYVDERARPYAGITDASDLVKKKIIPSVPFIRDQAKGFKLMKKDGIWSYRISSK